MFSHSLTLFVQSAHMGDVKGQSWIITSYFISFFFLLKPFPSCTVQPVLLFYKLSWIIFYYFQRRDIGFVLMLFTRNMFVFVCQPEAEGAHGAEAGRGAIYYHLAEGSTVYISQILYQTCCGKLVLDQSRMDRN